MTAVYTLGRLIWRPASLLLLFPLVLAFAAALLWSWPEQLDGLHDLRSTPELIHMLWRVNAVLVLAGSMSAMYPRELTRGTFAWSLPRIERRLFHGSILLCVLLALPLAAALGAVRGTAMGVAAFGIGFLLFAVGAELLDPLRAGNYRRALGLIVVVLLWRSDVLDQVAGASPVMFGILTGAAGVFLLHRAHHPSSARLRPFAADPSVGILSPEALRSYWSSRSAPELRWRRPLWSGTTGDWLATTYHEGGSASYGGWVLLMLPQFAIGGIMAYAMHSPFFAVFWAGSALAYGGLQLRMDYIYPISRFQRASIYYVASLAENVATSGAHALFLWLLFSLERPGFVKEVGSRQTFLPAEAAGFAVLAFALAPVVQWARINGPLRRSSGLTQPRGWGRVFALQLAFVMLALGALVLLGVGRNDSRLWPGVAVLAIVVQAIYWLAVRTHFMRADLVSS